jgi:DNA-binding transcriptional MerR regulator
VGFSLAEIADLLSLYDREDGGAAQMAASLGKFREHLVGLRRQRDDLDKAIGELEAGCVWLEEQLAQTRPDLLPRAEDYDSVLRSRLDAAE